MGATQSRTVEQPHSLVWFRHSGEPEVNQYRDPNQLVTDVTDIASTIEPHHIIHMCIKNSVPLNLHGISPRLTHLKVEKINNPAQLQSISSFTQLRELNLNKINFGGGELPAAIAQLNALEKLHINSCQLSHLPLSLGSLTKLKDLYMYSINFSQGLPDVVAQLTALEKLGLEKCQLVDLPQSLSSLTHLKELSLIFNNFDNGLPAVVGHLTSLNILQLSRCNLTDLPRSLRSLRQLKQLSLSENDFSERLPAVVGKIRRLEKLFLDNCELTSLPESLSSLTKLKNLYLSYSNFSGGLPDVVGRLCSVEKLMLDSCQLLQLPQSLGSLTQLKELYLFSNNFKGELPDVVGRLRSLEILWVDKCKLTNLPHSLSSLAHLKELSLNSNDFSKQLPTVIGQLNGLEKLMLNNCKLSNLPQRLSSATQLQELYLKGSTFERLPSVIYNMTNLRVLDLSGNVRLTRIESDLSKLENIEKLDCYLCKELQFPPYAVCKDGISTVRQYLRDLQAEEGDELSEVPVAVVGMTLSGKSSIIKSLRAGKRELTVRDESSPLDETTKVFNMQELNFQNASVKFIDYGGNDAYHMGYQLVIKERCIPLVVVNIEEFSKLSASRQHREATRRLCFDWLAHLYLACPELGPPLLALTHTDKSQQDEARDCKEKLLDQCEIIRTEVLEEDKQFQGELTKVLHFVDTQRPLFDPDDIFEFNNNLEEKANIELLKDKLESWCKRFTVRIPKLWERIVKFVESKDDKPFVLLSEVTKEFPCNELLTILRYMHNTGKVLWFENIESLSEYVFHQIPAITEMISLLFHHSSDKQWGQRIDAFIDFQHKGHTIGIHSYEAFIQQFVRTGELHEALLIHLLREGSDFPEEVCMDLLKSFFILHGPIKKCQTNNTYILPYFAKDFMDDSWKRDEPVPLRLEIALGGLPLPQYVYQLMTVAVLNDTVNLTTNIDVRRNGATIYHGDCVTHIIHDHNSRKITLQVSSTVEQLGLSWTHLDRIAKNLLNQLSKVWKACHFEVLVYCARCLIVRRANPAYHVNPKWFDPKDQRLNIDHTTSMTTISPLEKVSCAKCDGKSHRPSVPKPLRFPCEQLPADDIQKLKDHINDAIELERCSSELQVVEGNDDDGDDDDEPTPAADTAESDLSDVEEQGYCDHSSNIEISLQLKRVTDKKIKSLYRNTDKVYQMTDKVRGRVLIINIEHYLGSNQRRKGSAADVENISRLFKDLRFDIADIPKDDMVKLSKEEICRLIEEETHKEEHKCFGMFVLVLMSHGDVGGNIKDYYGHSLPFYSIKDLLSPRNFPAMKGKPKLVIIQACSGDREDQPATPTTTSTTTLHSESPTTTSTSTLPSESPTTTSTSTLPSELPSTTSTSTLHSESPTTTSRSTLPSELPTTTSTSTLHSESPTTTSTTTLPSESPIASAELVLNTDDFFIMKASSESYVATRSESHGAWFIRVLVATFYRHANHRDVESLFKIIQQRVRQVSLKSPLGGNVPTSICTFTNHRKLYLFPSHPVVR